MKSESTIRRWHHAPAHAFVPNAAYLVTAGTVGKTHFFGSEDRLHFLMRELFSSADRYGWQLQAWAVFANHYHLIAFAPTEVTTLSQLIQRLHAATARRVNEMDRSPGRRVWFQYWETCITREGSYYARLNYVHNIAVRHGLVPVANQYPFCSASWFEAKASPALYRKVGSYRYDMVSIPDDFVLRAE